MARAKYIGELVTQIKASDFADERIPLSRVDDEAWKARWKEREVRRYGAWLHAEYARKMHLLANHYAIDLEEEDSWMLLAFELARAHVPGFKVDHARRGRKPSPKTQEAFYEIYVKTLCGHSTSRACHLIARKFRLNPNSLRSAYNKYMSGPDGADLRGFIEHLLSEMKAETKVGEK